MANNTRDKILEQALEQFSERGYEGANIREISGALGMTKSAFYKHYASKEELWSSMLDRMEAYYEERFGSCSNLPDIPQSCEELFELAMGLFRLTVSDEQIVRVRKLLTLEQFRDERARMLATRHFSTGQEAMFSRIFAEMMDAGVLRKGDPAMLAFAFSAPISTLVQLCDREPERRPEAEEKAEHFVRTFCDIHGAEPERTIIRLRERPELLPRAADWFSSHWSVPLSAYTESMEASLTSAVPSWYLCLEGERIVGGMGVIENDFHNRPDLTPNVCAVFTEPDRRSRGIAGRLLRYVCEDMSRQGIDTLYLITDHVGFYERYGWQYICMVTEDGGGETRMYMHREEKL